MRLPTVLSAAAVAACAAACAIPAPGHASSTMQSSLMDDQQLLYESPERAAEALRAIAALGVDEVKVSLVWSLVAPDPSSSERPAFDAADPAAYRAGAWTRYDRIVLEAQKLGLKVSFMVIPPAPTWAIPQAHSRQGQRLGHAPRPDEFRQFVQAAGQRYSGHYYGLPRVSSWEVWNEPNFPAWLNPYYTRLPDGHREFLQPILYRELLSAAWQGLRSTGHRTPTDAILIGETDSPGFLSAAQFDRGLYCIDSALKPLERAAAARFGCPRSGSRASFLAANPALFEATGYAYHPYSFNIAPSARYPLRGWITIHNLSSLEGLLRGALAAYGKQRPRGFPIYLTEFGYESNPPNPYVWNSATQQATWLNETEYMAWRDPYVRMLNQFELIDSRPRAHARPGTRDYWGTFQTGLEFVSGKPKPALAAFRLPIWVPIARHGRGVLVWGQLRPLKHSGMQSAVVQFRPRGSTGWRQLPGDRITTTNGEGFFLARVPVPAPGAVRLACEDPVDGWTYHSRTVPIR